MQPEGFYETSLRERRPGRQRRPKNYASTGPARENAQPVSSKSREAYIDRSKNKPTVSAFGRNLHSSWLTPGSSGLSGRRKEKNKTPTTFDAKLRASNRSILKDDSVLEELENHVEEILPRKRKLSLEEYRERKKASSSSLHSSSEVREAPSLNSFRSEEAEVESGSLDDTTVDDPVTDVADFIDLTADSDDEDDQLITLSSGDEETASDQIERKCREILEEFDSSEPEDEPQVIDDSELDDF